MSESRATLYAKDMRLDACFLRIQKAATALLNAPGYIQRDTKTITPYNRTVCQVRFCVNCVKSADSGLPVMWFGERYAAGPPASLQHRKIRLLRWLKAQAQNRRPNDPRENCRGAHFDQFTLRKNAHTDRMHQICAGCMD
jgi:hypothetical protein